jgi:hypothetical protein
MKFILLLFIITISNIAVGQRTAVDRNTGRIISCDELSCDDTDSTYNDVNRNCLNCFMRLSDSMQAEKNKIMLKCKNQKLDVSPLLKSKTHGN